MTPFAYATPHSNAPYIERPRSGSGIGIYEDEDNSADEAREHEHQGGGSTTEELTGFERAGVLHCFGGSRPEAGVRAYAPPVELLSANAAETDLNVVQKREIEALNTAYRTPELADPVPEALRVRLGCRSPRGARVAQ